MFFSTFTTLPDAHKTLSKHWRHQFYHISVHSVVIAEWIPDGTGQWHMSIETGSKGRKTKCVTTGDIPTKSYIVFCSQTKLNSSLQRPHTADEAAYLNGWRRTVPKNILYNNNNFIQWPIMQNSVDNAALPFICILCLTEHMNRRLKCFEYQFVNTKANAKARVSVPTQLGWSRFQKRI